MTSYIKDLQWALRLAIPAAVVGSAIYVLRQQAVGGDASFNNAQVERKLSSAQLNAEWGFLDNIPTQWAKQRSISVRKTPYLVQRLNTRDTFHDLQETPSVKPQQELAPSAKHHHRAPSVKQQPPTLVKVVDDVSPSSSEISETAEPTTTITRDVEFIRSKRTAALSPPVNRLKPTSSVPSSPMLEEVIELKEEPSIPLMVKRTQGQIAIDPLSESTMRSRRPTDLHQTRSAYAQQHPSRASRLTVTRRLNQTASRSLPRGPATGRESPLSRNSQLSTSRGNQLRAGGDRIPSGHKISGESFGATPTLTTRRPGWK